MTDMADYKQLCAELLDWTRLLIEIPDPPVTRCADDLTDLLARTRAALAEPEPESELRNNTLSPAAYAVVAAAHQEGHTNRLGLAAALRVVSRYCKRDTLLLLDLADELEELPND